MSKKSIRHIFGHILFWVILMLTYAVSEWGYRNNFGEAILFELIFLFPRLVAVYLNWFVLIPRFLYKHKILHYFAILIGLLIVLSIFQRFFTLYWAYPVFFPGWMNQGAQPWGLFRIVQNIVILAFPVAFATGIQLFLDWFDEKNKTKQLEMENRKAELKYLKSQVNPHFLFNTLNSLYGLSLEHSQKVPRLILKFSDYLHYSLYEASATTISLQKEWELIESYIELEKERHGNRVSIEMNMETDSFMEEEVAPLLFFPLVENAFKHGVSEALTVATIFVTLKKVDKTIFFEVKNSVPPPDSESRETGIGIANLRRRLNLLYPNMHELTIVATEIFFTVTLTLRLYE